MRISPELRDVPLKAGCNPVASTIEEAASGAIPPRPAILFIRSQGQASVTPAWYAGRPVATAGGTSRRRWRKQETRRPEEPVGFAHEGATPSFRTHLRGVVE